MSDVGTSKNIATYDAGEYIVTAALWVNVLGYDTYEIGIRERGTGKFHLLQSEKYNHQSVQEVANAIAHLIGMPAISGEHYTPEWCERYMT